MPAQNQGPSRPQHTSREALCSLVLVSIPDEIWDGISVPLLCYGSVELVHLHVQYWPEHDTKHWVYE